MRDPHHKSPWLLRSRGLIWSATIWMIWGRPIVGTPYMLSQPATSLTSTSVMDLQLRIDYFMFFCMFFILCSSYSCQWPGGLSQLEHINSHKQLIFQRMNPCSGGLKAVGKFHRGTTHNRCSWYPHWGDPSLGPSGWNMTRQGPSWNPS